MLCEVPGDCHVWRECRAAGAFPPQVSVSMVTTRLLTECRVRDDMCKSCSVQDFVADFLLQRGMGCWVFRGSSLFWQHGCFSCNLPDMALYGRASHVCNPPHSRTAEDGNGFLVGVPCGFSECQSSVSALLHPLLWVPFLDCAELFFWDTGAVANKQYSCSREGPFRMQPHVSSAGRDPNVC